MKNRVYSLRDFSLRAQSKFLKSKVTRWVTLALVINLYIYSYIQKGLSFLCSNIFIFTRKLPSKIYEGKRSLFIRNNLNLPLFLFALPAKKWRPANI